MKKWAAMFSFLVLLTLSLQSRAGTVKVSTNATATLAGSCTVNAGNIAIGALAPGTPSSSGSSQVGVLCTKGTAYSWYVEFRQDGWDCPFITGAVSKDTIYYMFYYDNHYQVYTSPANGNPHTGIGTGFLQTAPLYAYIQPNQSYAPCPRKPVNPGYNPFATPDTYSDSDWIVLNF